MRKILWGLATWPTHPLGYEHAMRYVDDIEAVANGIDRKIFHVETSHPVHQRYGSHIHIYRRNRHTHWYIIYQWFEMLGIAYVTKILNNFTTDAYDSSLASDDD